MLLEINATFLHNNFLESINSLDSYQKWTKSRLSFLGGACKTCKQVLRKYFISVCANVKRSLKLPYSGHHRDQENCPL